MFVWFAAQKTKPGHCPAVSAAPPQPGPAAQQRFPSDAGITQPDCAAAAGGETIRRKSDAAEQLVFLSSPRAQILTLSFARRTQTSRRRRLPSSAAGKWKHSKHVELFLKPKERRPGSGCRVPHEGEQQLPLLDNDGPTMPLSSPPPASYLPLHPSSFLLTDISLLLSPWFPAFLEKCLQ